MSISQSVFPTHFFDSKDNWRHPAWLVPLFVFRASTWPTLLPSYSRTSNNIPPNFLLKPSSFSSKHIPPICIFLSPPAGVVDVINKHKTIKLASNYTFPIYWSVFVRLRNIMILSDKLKQLLSKSLFMMLHIFIWKGKQENKARGGQKGGGSGKPATLLFLPDDAFAALRERRGRSNVEPLFATALINSARYLRAQERLCYFRMEVEQWWWRRRRRREKKEGATTRRWGGSERGLTEILILQNNKGGGSRKRNPIAIISASAEVIGRVIYACWINAQRAASVNVVTGPQQPRTPFDKINVTLISAGLLLRSVKKNKQTNADCNFVNGGKQC